MQYKTTLYTSEINVIPLQDPFLLIHWERERENERERERERERETDRQTERQTKTERERERESVRRLQSPVLQYWQFEVVKTCIF